MRSAIDMIPAVLLTGWITFYVIKIIAYVRHTSGHKKAKYADNVKIVTQQCKNRNELHTTH
jgi:hypothetical protein